MSIAGLGVNHWSRYLRAFLDGRTFSDGKAAAAAIAVQSRIDHGPGDTMMLEIATILEFNARAIATERRERGEWLQDFQAGAR